MYKQICNQFWKFFLLFAILGLQPDCLSAQSKFSSKNQIRLKDGRYHFEKGWVNSGGVSISPFIPFVILGELFEGIGQTYPVQFEYTGYKLLKPKLGLGVSISYSLYPTNELGYEHFTHYQFLDIGMYGKIYLSNKRRRVFVDSKVGYGFTPKNSIRFGCYSCDRVGTLYIRYTSGPMFQPGIGIEFASAKFLKWGIKLSHSSHYNIRHQRDRHESRWKTTSDGIIKRDTDTRSFGAMFFGFNFYL